MPFFVDVLKSKVNGFLYKGHTANLQNRVVEHNSGQNRSTKPYIPWELIYYEQFKTRKEAVSREKYFKSGSGREFLRKLLVNR